MHKKAKGTHLYELTDKHGNLITARLENGTLCIEAQLAKAFSESQTLDLFQRMGWEGEEKRPRLYRVK